MRNKFKNMTRCQLILCLTVIFSICAVLYYIFYCTKAIFNSDMAYWLLLADEQLKAHSFYPEGFFYTTGVPTISTEILVLFLRFFSSNWILCREIAVATVTLIMFVFIYFFYKRTLSHGSMSFFATSTTIILLCYPMMQYPQTYYEAAYELQTIWDLLLMFFVYKIITDCSNEKAKKKFLHLSFFIVAFVASMGIKNLSLFMFPLIITIPLMGFIENDYHFELIFKNKNYNNILVITIIGALGGALTYMLISKNVGLASLSAGMSFVGYEHIVENVHTLFTNIVQYYSAATAGSIFSLTGITSCINFVVMCFCSVCAPVWALSHYWKSDNSFWKLYTIYAWIGNFIALYFMVFTSANHYGYYRPVFWHNIVFTAIFVANIIEKKDKYYQRFFILLLVLLTICGHLGYFKNTVLPIRAKYAAEKSQGTLVDFLKENDLYYGFSSFWHAYKYMALSSGEIQLIAYTGVPTSPFYWMTSSSYYDVNEHPGKCFILVSPEDSIEEKYYTFASEILKFQDYTILVYDKNIRLIRELS